MASGEKKVSLMLHVASLPADAKFYTVLPDGTYGYTTKADILAGLLTPDLQTVFTATTGDSTWNINGYTITFNTAGELIVSDGNLVARISPERGFEVVKPDGNGSSLLDNFSLNFFDAIGKQYRVAGFDAEVLSYDYLARLQKASGIIAFLSDINLQYLLDNSSLDVYSNSGMSFFSNLVDAYTQYGPLGMESINSATGKTVRTVEGVVEVYEGSSEAKRTVVMARELFFADIHGFFSFVFSGLSNGGGNVHFRAPATVANEDVAYMSDLGTKADLIGGIIPAYQLPSFVDDIVEGYKSGLNFYANLAHTVLITGEGGKIYVDLTSGQKYKQYRWSGATYIQITNGLIASSDDVPEGSNLYFTEGRVLAVVLTGLSLVTGGAISSTDSLLACLGKLQKQITDLGTIFAAIASPTFTGTVTTPAIVVSSETASTIASFDTSKKLKSLPLSTYPSLAELAYVKGLNANLQAQLDSMVRKSRYVFQGATSITGATVETVVFTMKISGGTYAASDAFNFDFSISKSVTASSVEYRTYVGLSAGAITGPTSIWIGRTIPGATSRGADYNRKYVLDNNNLLCSVGFTTNALVGASTSTAAASSTPLNPSNDFWITLTAQPSIASETVGVLFASITPLK